MFECCIAEDCSEEAVMFDRGSGKQENFRKQKNALNNSYLKCQVETNVIRAATLLSTTFIMHYG
jgi:hypothetical protein